MKMSVMANSTLSHSYNISVTDYQTEETHSVGIKSTKEETERVLKQCKDQGCSHKFTLVQRVVHRFCSI